jgi:nitrogen fixation protein NifX
MLRVAFATEDGIHVNQHFGWATRFDVYDLDADTSVLVEVRTLPPAGDGGSENGSDKVQSRLDTVADCAIVHISSVGGTAAARMIGARIHPVKIPETTRVTDLVARLQTVLAGNPPPWLRKVLRHHLGSGSSTTGTSTGVTTPGSTGSEAAEGVSS